MPAPLERTLNVEDSTLDRPLGKETVMSHNALQPESKSWDSFLRHSGFSRLSLIADRMNNFKNELLWL